MSRQSGSGHKARQLCRQVHEHLELAFGELDDPVLDGVSIFAVDVDARGTTLRVGVIVPDDRDPAIVRPRLEAARGRLRAEIAAAIHRKRTPQIWFAIQVANATVETTYPARVVADPLDT